MEFENLSASYDVGIAKKYGIQCAVLLNKIIYLSKYSSREDGFCWKTAKELEDELGLSRYQQDLAIKKLEDEGIIETKNTYIIGTQIKCKHFKIIDKSEMRETNKSDFQETNKSDFQETNKSDFQETNKSVNNNKNINNNTLIIIHNKRKYIKESKKIINRLNELNNTHYRYNSDNTLKLIEARLNEGYTEDDLLLVVDKMSYLWNKEPSKNEIDMRPYLRPSTLFRKSNFENYLNMNIQKKEKTLKDISVEEIEQLIDKEKNNE